MRPTFAFEIAAILDCRQTSSFIILVSDLAMPDFVPPEKNTISWNDSSSRQSGNETRAASTEHSRRLSLQSGTLVGQEFDGYRIVAEISQGGMGAVYHAIQAEPVRRDVALKVVKFNSVSEHWFKRFEAERQAMAMMEHPCVARIFDGGALPDGAPYLSMELVDGKPFSEYCDSRALSVKQRLELLVQVCRAVQHAHNRGIIHRDLKPSNVLVSEVDGKPLPKVIDFGLAKSIDAQAPIADTELTMQGAVMGTAVYMSPEQAAGETLDGRTDVYSLGVMLFEALVGSTPIEAKSLQGLQPLQRLELICDYVPPRPSHRLAQSADRVTTVAEQRSTSTVSLKSMLSGELDWIVLQAIEKDLERRYQTVQDLADDIERYLQHEPVQAKPPSVSYRARKFVQRNRLQVALVGTVLAAALLAGILLPAIFSYQRNAQLAELKSGLLSHPSEFVLTTEEFQQQAKLVESIAALDADQSKPARSNLATHLVTALSTAVERPRLTDEALSRYQDLLSTLTASPLLTPEQDQLQAIENRLQELKGAWVRVFVSEEGHPESLAQAFEQGTVRVVSDGVKMLAQADSKTRANREKFSSHEWRDSYIPLTETKIACSGDTRVQATFSQLGTTTEVAVSLNATDDLGYDFVLRRAEPQLSLEPSESKTGLEGNSGTSGRSPRAELLLAEIRRGEVVLLRQVIRSEQIATDALIRITATREQNELSIQINALPAQSIFDPFPLSTTDFGVIGIRALPSDTLLGLATETKPTAVQSSGLTRGDLAFGRGEFDLALQDYQDERRQNEDLNLRAEADYKAAVSLQKLGRDEEAIDLLQRLEVGQVRPWSTLAAISVWESSLDERDLEKQRAALNRLLALQDATSVTSLLPEATRTRIVQTQLKTFRMSDLLRPDPTRLQRTAFAAEMDRVLSIDGRGSLSGQTQYARTLRFEGKLLEAAEVLRNLNERYEIPHLTVVYSRLLRVLNKPQEAYTFLQRKRERMSVDTLYVLQELAMCEFALGRNADGDQTLRSALALGNTDVATAGGLLLAIGFRQYQDNERDLARDTWRRGYLESRKQLEMNPNSSQSATITMLILGGLSGDLRPEDSQAFVNVMLEGAQMGQMRLTLGTVLPQHQIHRILLNMWNTERGMQVAEDIAFQRIDLRTRTIAPAEVAVYQVFISGAFDSQASKDDREVCLQAANRILQAYFETNELRMSHVPQMGMAWMGLIGLPPNLPESFKSHAHYLIGNKLLRQGRTSDAIAQFKQALFGPSPDAAVQPQTLVQQRASLILDLLERKLGILELEGEPSVLPSLEFRDQAGEAVELIASESDRRRLVQPGSYTIRSPSESWSSPVEIRLGETTVVKIPSKWATSKRQGKIRGLLSHPAKLPDIDDWQLVQDSMQAHSHDLSWSPDGARLAIVGDDTIRIADALTGQYEESIAVSGEQLRCVDWSVKDVLSVGTRTGKVFMIDATAHTISESNTRYPARITSLQWNQDGSLLAVSGEFNATHIYDESRELIHTIQGTTGHWMGKVRWSPSGRLLAVLGAKEVEVWNTLTWDRLYRFEGIKVGWDLLWNSSEASLIVTDNQFLRKISIDASEVQLEIPGGARSISWANDSETIIQGIWSGSDGLHSWDLTESVEEPPSRRNLSGYDPILFSPDGIRIARGNPNGGIISNPNFEQEVIVGRLPHIQVLSTSFSQRHHLLAALGKHVPKLKVLNLKNGQTQIYAPADNFRSCCWNHDGKWLAAGTTDGRVLFFTPDGEIRHEERVSEQSVTNIGWLSEDDAVIIGTETGQLSLVQLKIGRQTLSGSQKILKEGDGLFTDWVGSHLALSAESAAGVYYRKGRFIQFQVEPTFHEVQLVAPPPMPHSTVCYLSGDRILSKRYGGYDFTAATQDWQTQARTLTQTPTCFRELAPELVLFGTDEGVINTLDLVTGQVEYVCDTGSELLSLDLLSDQIVLAVNVHGTIRKINFQTGKVEQLAMLTQNEAMLCVTGGGRLLSPEESLNGFSCIIRRRGKLESVPAVELLQ